MYSKSFILRLWVAFPLCRLWKCVFRVSSRMRLTWISFKIAFTTTLTCVHTPTIQAPVVVKPIHFMQWYKCDIHLWQTHKSLNTSKNGENCLHVNKRIDRTSFKMMMMMMTMVMWSRRLVLCSRHVIRSSYNVLSEFVYAQLILFQICSDFRVFSLHLLYFTLCECVHHPPNVISFASNLGKMIIYTCVCTLVVQD